MRNKKEENIDIVDIKKLSKTRHHYYLKSNQIYCEDFFSEEKVIVGRYDSTIYYPGKIEIIKDNKKELISLTPKLIYIKKDFDMSLLLNIDFKIREEDGFYVKKIYLCNDDDDKNFYAIDPNTRIVYLTRLDGQLDDTIITLYKIGAIE